MIVKYCTAIRDGIPVYQAWVFFEDGTVKDVKEYPGYYGLVEDITALYPDAIRTPVKPHR